MERGDLMDKEFNLKLTTDETEVLVKILSKQPYDNVIFIIPKLQKQFREQFPDYGKNDMQIDNN
jgi:hypothetical protein